METREQYLNGHFNRKYFCSFDFFENIDTEEKAYWLGFIAADGSVYRKILEIGVYKNDVSLLHMFQKHIKSDHVIHHTKENMSRLCIGSEKLVNDLKMKGIDESKTGKLDPYIIFNNIPEILRRHFCRGFIDGDGSFACGNKKGSRINFKLGCKGYLFLNYFQDIIIGFTGLTKTKLYKYKDREDYYTLTWGGTVQLRKLYNFLYDDATCFLERKKKKIEAYFVYIENNMYKRDKNRYIIDYSEFSYKNYSNSERL